LTAVAVARGSRGHIDSHVKQPTPSSRALAKRSRRAGLLPPSRWCASAVSYPAKLACRAKTGRRSSAKLLRNFVAGLLAM